MNQRSKSRVVLGVAIAAILIAAFGGGLYFLENHFQEDEEYGYEDDSQVLYFDDDEYEITHNVESYVLIGTDDSGNVKAKGTKNYRGQMADFILLFIMDRTAGTHGFLQIDRNTMVNVPILNEEGDELYEQICTAHWYGTEPQDGAANTALCVSRLVGELEIDGYYSIHMSDIGIMNNAVDGVEVTLDEDFSESDPEMTKGKTLTLNDEQAEIFVRGRMNIGEGTNEERMSRQLTYMTAFKDKAKARIGEDVTFVNDLWDMLKEEATTNIPESTVSVMANELYKGEDLGILTIDGETKIGTTLDDGREHEEFYPETQSIAEAIATLCGIDEKHITRY